MPDVEGSGRAAAVAPRRSRLLLLVVVVLVAAGAASGGWYVYVQYTTHLTVTGINWEVFVNNTSVGYMFNSESAGCEGQCPVNALVDSVWTYAFTFPFASASYNTTVVNVTLPAPFHVLSTSPPTPIVLTGVGFSVSFRVAIRLPSGPGTYAVTGALWER